MTALAAYELLNKISRLLKDNKGQGMTEYVLLIAFIALVVVVGLTPVGPAVSAKFAEMVGILSGP